MRKIYINLLKRIFDVIFSLLGIIFLLFFLLPIAFLIYFEDKGTVFYNSKRVGKNGKIFKMYKFRTMKVNAPDIRNNDGSTFNSEDDPRLTKIGKFIRNYSIDEIPQLINVIKGEMSLIGPRPDLPEHLNMYTMKEKRKLLVLPGITGYNQAYFRNSISWKERLKNDIFYVNNIGLILDVKIFVKTIISIIKKDGIYVKK